MIEMRWLVPVEGAKVLQYRYKIQNTQWSEWCEVPVVAERDPSYP